MLGRRHVTWFDVALVALVAVGCGASVTRPPAAAVAIVPPPGPPQAALPAPLPAHPPAIDPVALRAAVKQLTTLRGADMPMLDGPPITGEPDGVAKWRTQRVLPGADWAEVARLPGGGFTYNAFYGELADRSLAEQRHAALVEALSSLPPPPGGFSHGDVNDVAVHETYWVYQSDTPDLVTSGFMITVFTYRDPASGRFRVGVHVSVGR